MSDHARGGDDKVVSGGSAINSIEYSGVFGHSYRMDGQSRGGDDYLKVSGGPTKSVIGDAFEMQGRARGGDDRIETGIGDDNLWGDAVVKDRSIIAGKDTFVFTTESGNDTVHDFEHGKDRIDLRDFATLGILSLKDLDWEIVGGATYIQLAGDVSVTLVGVSTLYKGDFFFG